MLSASCGVILIATSSDPDDPIHDPDDPIHDPDDPIHDPDDPIRDPESSPAAKNENQTVEPLINSFTTLG